MSIHELMASSAILDPRSDVRDSMAVGVRERVRPGPRERGNETFTFSAFGVRIGIDAPDAGLIGRMLDRLPPGWAPEALPTVDRLYAITETTGSASQGENSVIQLMANGDAVGRTTTWERALDVLASDIERYVAEHASPWLFVHAGVVGWRGQAIVLPGSSFAGKSTLVAALVAAGATYYSDEYAVFNAAGQVLPFPRPLTLRRSEDSAPRRIDVRELSPGGEFGRLPLPIGLVALTAYGEGEGWRARLLSSGAGIVALCMHTVDVRRRPAAAFDIFSKVVATAPVLQGMRGEAEATAVQLLRSGFADGSLTEGDGSWPKARA